MERREFFTKLVRSLLIITAVAALSFVLSGKSTNTFNSCPTNKDCRGCQKSGNCGLPTKKQHQGAEFIGSVVNQNSNHE